MGPAIVDTHCSLGGVAQAADGTLEDDVHFFIRVLLHDVSPVGGVHLVGGAAHRASEGGVVQGQGFTLLILFW